jgi:DHA1 family tetracycline resistance protein-like MFS transporter
LTESAAPRGRPAALGFIFVASALNAVSYGLMIPVLPNLIRSFFGATSAASTASAADWQFVFGMTWGAMQFLSGPLLGMMSDRWGRRSVMLISIFGLSVDFLVMTFAPSVTWLLIGRVFNGLTASSFSTASAYVADISGPETRARNFGWMTAASSGGFLLGPPIGAILATIPVHIGPLALDPLRTPFLVAACVCAANWVYGVVLLPESLPPERRAKAFVWRSANPFGSLVLLRAHADLLPLASINFLGQLAGQAFVNVFVLYTALRYHWDLGILAAALFATGAIDVLVSLFVVGPVVKRIGERRAILVGVATAVFGFAAFGLATPWYSYFVLMFVFAMFGITPPALQALMTQHVSSSEQGRLQGANTSIGGIASIVGPAIFPLSYAFALRSLPGLPGLPMLIAAGFMAIALVLAIGFARRESRAFS